MYKLLREHEWSPGNIEAIRMWGTTYPGCVKCDNYIEIPSPNIHMCCIPNQPPQDPCDKFKYSLAKEHLDLIKDSHLAIWLFPKKSTTRSKRWSSRIIPRIQLFEDLPNLKSVVRISYNQLYFDFGDTKQRLICINREVPPSKGRYSISTIKTFLRQTLSRRASMPPIEEDSVRILSEQTSLFKTVMLTNLLGIELHPYYTTSVIYFREGEES